MRAWDHFGRDFGMGLNLRMTDMQFIGSREIWLALDDADNDSRYKPVKKLFLADMAQSREIDSYHRQLFYWLIVRGSPCGFSPALKLKTGVPTLMREHN